MIDVNEINLDAIRSTITFLSENEEYGDDLPRRTRQMIQSFPI